VSVITSLVKVLSKISRWSDQKDSHSWVVHGAIAVPITLISAGLWKVLVALGVSPVAAAGIVSTFTAYAIRELEQRAHEMMAGYKPKDKDHFWDLVIPAAVATVVGLLLLS